MACYEFEGGALLISEMVIDHALAKNKGRVTREEHSDVARVANEIRKERNALRKRVKELEFGMELCLASSDIKVVYKHCEKLVRG